MNVAREIFIRWNFYIIATLAAMIYALLARNNLTINLVRNVQYLLLQ
jgi:hypothetical protein